MEELDKVKITAWLRKHNRDRDWLAKHTGSEIGTVNSWFSTRGFPDGAIATIRALMQLDDLKGAEPSTPPPDETRLIEFTSGEFEEIEAARARVGSPSRPDFYHDAIMKYARELPIDDLDEEVTSDGDSYEEGAGEDVKEKFRDAASAFEKLNPPPSQKSPPPGKYSGPSRGGKTMPPPGPPSTP